MKNKIIEWFKNKYNNLYEQMNIVTHTHDNGNLSPYHLEGSIWNHTMMVLEWIEEDNINHIFAGLLHDLGKLDTRIVKTDKVSFTYHENVSTYKSIDILKEAKKTFEELDIIKVLKLIAWHGTLWTKTGSIEDTLKDIDLKYGHNIEFFKDFLKFVEADALGREMESKQEEERVINQINFLNNYIPYDKTQYKVTPKNEVIFLIGISGSGKSTLVDKLNVNNKYKIVSVDNLLTKGKLNYNSIDYSKNVKKAFDQTMKDMLLYIQNEENIIVDMTSLDKETRRKKLSKFPVTKYNKKAIIFLNGEKSIKENLSKRKDKTIDKDLIKAQIFNFELPNYDEFDVLEFII